VFFTRPISAFLLVLGMLTLYVVSRPNVAKSREAVFEEEAV
jgi:hypothetical protein